MRKCWYAVYKGDKFLTHGTAVDCGKYLGVLPHTIKFYSTPTYKKRVSVENGIIVVKVGEIKKGEVE